MQFDKSSELFAPFRGGRIYAGFSGGADSTALLLLLTDLREHHDFRLTAVHFEHGLRGAESRREAGKAEEFARGLGVEFLRFDLALTPGSNLEAAARAARLAVWRKLAGNRADTAVALGHHADDRVETLLLRLGRGSNTSGLVALRPRAVVDGVTFLRPLLHYTRVELTDFLHSRNINSWQHDSSNDTGEFERNFLRNQLLPAWTKRRPGVMAGVRRTLEALGQDAAFLEEEAERRFRRIAGRSATEAGFWRELPPALFPRVLRLHLSNELGRDFIPSAALTGELRRLLAVETQDPRHLKVASDLILRLQGSELELIRTAEPPADACWEWRRRNEFRWGRYLLVWMEIPAGSLRTKPEEAIFDPAGLPEQLTISARRPGDRIIPFGRKREESLRKLRIDRGLPAEFDAPVIRDDTGRILWAPFIRHSAGAAATPVTVRPVRFTIHGD